MWHKAKSMELHIRNWSSEISGHRIDLMYICPINIKWSAQKLKTFLRKCNSSLWLTARHWTHYTCISFQTRPRAIYNWILLIGCDLGNNLVRFATCPIRSQWNFNLASVGVKCSWSHLSVMRAQLKHSLSCWNINTRKYGMHTWYKWFITRSVFAKTDLIIAMQIPTKNTRIIKEPSPTFPTHCW